MATGTGLVGIDSTPPEVNLARMILNKRSKPLSPPIDVATLIREHASLSFASFPVNGVDGVCLNLKGGVAKAKVIINTNTPPTRQNFTMAHELGHLVIPWHVGSIIDNIDPNSSAAAANEYEYFEREAEANRFAAELLMPTQWVGQLVDDYQDLDLAELHQKITQEAEVSPIAAAIRMTPFLLPGIVWIIENQGKIQNHGMSSGTLVPRIWARDQAFDENIYPFADKHYRWSSWSSNIHWWELPSELSTENNDSRSWREILEGMLTDIGYEDRAFQKQSLNGVIGAVNSTLKSQAKNDITINYSPSSLAAACFQRFSDSEHTEFFNHPDFRLYVQKRSESIFENVKK